MRDVGLSAATVLLCASDGKARLAPFPLDWWQPAQLFKYTIAPGKVASPLRSAKAVGLVLPEVNGKLTGISLRVPVAAGSITDLVATLKKNVTKEEINAAMKAASQRSLKGILEYNEDPIVSSDVIGNPHSCVFDSGWTSVISGNMVKVLGWYDNEYGYSSRTADLIARIARL